MKHKIRIVFKSGYVETFKCDEFRITRTGGGIEKMSWEGIEPNILHITLNEIAAVIRLS